MSDCTDCEGERNLDVQVRISGVWNRMNNDKSDRRFWKGRAEAKSCRAIKSVRTLNFL